MTKGRGITTRTRPNTKTVDYRNRNRTSINVKTTDHHNLNRVIIKTKTGDRYKLTYSVMRVSIPIDFPTRSFIPLLRFTRSRRPISPSSFSSLISSTLCGL